MDYDRVTLRNLDDFIAREYNNINGMIIRKSEDVIFEYYAEDFEATDTTHIASVTKSILSLLIGIALDKGLIKDISQNVLEFFPEYKIKRGEKKIQQIQVRDLLTMTAPYKYKSEPYTKVYTSNDWTKAALDLLGGKKDTVFQYSTVGMQILSGILVKATGQSVLDFAGENLFAPLAINIPGRRKLQSKEQHLDFIRSRKNDGWVTDSQGIQTGGWGLTLSVSDMAKIGQLCVNHGLWQEKRILSDKWIRESTKEQSRWGNLRYGYLWWLTETGYAAMGDGGNVIYCNEERNIVVAILSGFKPRAKDRIELIERFILPAIEGIYTACN